MIMTNEAQKKGDITAYFSTPRHSFGVTIVLIAIVTELFFIGKLIINGYNDHAMLGAGLAYGCAAVAFIWDALAFIKASRFRTPLKAVFVFLVAPLVIQLFVLFSFLNYLVKLISRKPKAKVIKKKAKRINRLEKLVPLRVGDTVTFTPEKENPIVGVVRRINQKSTTVVSQAGESWRVPHDESELIVRSKPAQLKGKSTYKLELVR